MSDTLNMFLSVAFQFGSCIYFFLHMWCIFIFCQTFVAEVVFFVNINLFSISEDTASVLVLYTLFFHGKLNQQVMPKIYAWFFSYESKDESVFSSVSMVLKKWISVDRITLWASIWWLSLHIRVTSEKLWSTLSWWEKKCLSEVPLSRGRTCLISIIQNDQM